MGHRNQPRKIIHIDEFSRDFEQAHSLVIKHLREVAVATEHSKAITEAAVALVAAIRTVTGKPPSWSDTTRRGLTAD